MLSLFKPGNCKQTRVQNSQLPNMDQILAKTNFKDTEVDRDSNLSFTEHLHLAVHLTLYSFSYIPFTWEVSLVGVVCDPPYGPLPIPSSRQCSHENRNNRSCLAWKYRSECVVSSLEPIRTGENQRNQHNLQINKDVYQPS